MLRKAGSSVVVDKILEAGDTSPVKLGDEIIAIGGKKVGKNLLQAVVTRLTNMPRPLSVTFRRVSECTEASKEIRIESTEKICDEERWNDDYGDFAHTKSNFHIYEEPVESMNDSQPTNQRYPFTIKMKCGVPNGLSIEKSPCGDAAVITRVNQTVFQSAMLENYGKLIPKEGHLLLAVNQNPLHKIGFQRAKAILDNIASSKDQDECEITLVEVSSDDWGTVDKIDVIISRMSLSIVDDIAGRDMPLLRGTLQSIAMRIERGLGLECNGITVNPPSIILYNNSSNDSDSVKKPYISSDLSELIVKVYANAETMLDYYNARIASWEPLLEPSHLNIALEYQRGNQNRPGALSLALSDHQAVDGPQHVQQSLVCLNISDAAANVLISAFYEWKQWRKRVHSDTNLVSSLSINSLEAESKLVNNKHERCETNDENNNQLKNQEHVASPSKVGLPNSINIVDMKKEAVQNAAHAALIYARRRGLESKSTNGAKPFVLRNKTGMKLSFVPQIQQNLLDEENVDDIDSICFDLKKFLSSSITEIDDGDEACFSMNTIERDGLISEAGLLHKNGNKIRTYDGQFPLLSISLQCPNNSRVEIAQDLSVVKIGKKLRRLKVQKDTGINTEEGHINVVWSVELEHNRRIITISSAVTLASSKCSIPIEIGIKLWDGDAIYDYKNEGIKSIGFAAPDRSCYLPLWIDVSFQRAEIFVRPTTNSRSYLWSSQNILEFKCAHTNKSVGGALDRKTWKWIVTGANGSIICYSNNTHSQNLTLSPAWLSFEYHHGGLDMSDNPKNSGIPIEDEESDFNMISVNLFSSLSIRNILPESVEWEVAEVKTSRDGKNYDMLDGSTLRNHSLTFCKSFIENEDGNSCEIKSGHRKEVLPCNVASMNLEARFRCFESEWTQWVSINSHQDPASQTDETKDKGK